jgi:hypothetical protein
MALAVSTATAAVVLAGAAQAQMVVGSAGFNGGYNQAGNAVNTNGGFNHFPDQENGPVNVQTTDLNASNLSTDTGLAMSPSAFSVFANSSGVSGALDTFAGAGAGGGSGTTISVTVDTPGNVTTTSNANGKP